jgi:folate-dependent phosphoribosylglycinamide formyltransferase PurN
LFKKAIGRIIGYRIARAWQEVNKYYSEKHKFNAGASNIVRVDSANSETVMKYFRDEQPGLVIVSGTDLLKKETINALPEKTIINLHTGLSPYINGGPNCTNWSLSIGRPDLIGNTVMWIDPGIDSGGIIATAQTEISDCTTLTAIHIRQFESAHQVYIKCINRILEDREKPAGVKQDDITTGVTFYTREWNVIAMFRELVYLRFFLKHQKKLSLPVKTISVDE